MILQQLISGYINSKHGWTVAEQFDLTFSNAQDFEKQNHNALKYIHEAINKILNSDVLNEDAYDELCSYRDDLSNYLTN
jgi:hypothetical protein